MTRGERARALGAFAAGISLLPLALGAFTMAARADLIGDVLKIGGVTLVVNRFGDQINNGLNKLTGTRENDPQFTTKVVTVFTPTGGGDIGAVQVAGPRGSVEKVKAVAQLETRVLGIRVRALIPVSAKGGARDIKRVQGVGVSGLVDIKV